MGRAVGRQFADGTRKVGSRSFEGTHCMLLMRMCVHRWLTGGACCRPQWWPALIGWMAARHAVCSKSAVERVYVGLGSAAAAGWAQLPLLSHALRQPPSVASGAAMVLLAMAVGDIDSGPAPRFADGLVITPVPIWCGRRRPC
jgi:hypothetical protein